MRTLVAVAAGTLLGSVVPFARAALAETWNVDPSGSGDATTIQAALDLVAPGDVILVAPGTYRDDNRRIVHGYSSVCSTYAVAHLAPGVTIVGSGGAAVTVVDGEDVRHGFVGADLGTVVINGITFANCMTASNFCDGLRGGQGGWGGGVLSYRSDLTIQGCRFVDCRALAGGGGVFIQGGTHSTVTGSLFVRCSAGDLGGGAEIFETAGTFRHCTFYGNSAERWGSAITFNGTGGAVENCILSHGTALGGALGCLSGAIVECNLFFANMDPPEGHPCGPGGTNVESAPLFCNAAMGDFTIHSGSAADPGQSACGLRGAFPVACGPVSVERSTWGSTKAAYR